jgi:hypothetical protein
MQEQTPQWVVAFITVIYALFAGLQWWTIRRQSQNFIDMERPWVFLGYVKLNRVLTPNVPVVVDYVWTNNGRSLAVIIEQNVEVRLVESLPGEPKYNPAMITSGYGIMSPGPPSPSQRTRADALSLSDLAQINDGQKGLYWLGYLIYEDAMRKRRTYRFCFRYTPATGEFVPNGPEAYNWWD